MFFVSGKEVEIDILGKMYFHSFEHISCVDK